MGDVTLFRLIKFYVKIPLFSLEHWRAQLQKIESTLPDPKDCESHQPPELQIESIHEIILRCMRGSLKQDSVLATLNELADMHKIMPQVIQNVIQEVDGETEKLDAGHEERIAFLAIVKEADKFLTTTKTSNNSSSSRRRSVDMVC